MLVATLLNKTSGPLQQHLRLNARNLTTYEDIRATILEYHQSRHILTGAAASASQGPAPMDIGGLKGKKGFGKGGLGYFKGKKGKGKGKGKKGKGKNPHVNFHNSAMAKGKGKGKEKGKSKLRGQHALVCWTCGKTGHVASQCPSGRVSALDDSLFGEVEDLGDQTWGLRKIGLQAIGLRTGGLTNLSPRFMRVILGMMIGGGQLGTKAGMMHGPTLLGVWFELLWRRLLHLQPLLPLSPKQLQVQL